MRLLKVCLLFLVLCLFASTLLAQTVTGTLSGRVTDKTGAVIADAKIAIRGEQTGLTREGVTNGEGYYRFSFLPLGTYEVTANAPGFKTIKKTGVTIELNTITSSDFTFEVAGEAIQVEVRGGEMPLIDTTTGEVKSALTETQVTATPLAGRNFISLVEQVPGFQPAPFNTSSNNPTNSTGSYAAFSGQGTRSSTFQVDGINNDDSSENQNRQNVNISTIKEFQVLTNSSSAEFGRAGGAVILVQTKSGTNSFHGDGFDFIQNDIFNANDYFTNAAGAPRPPVRRNDYGGTIGGPVIKNKLFFFGSGERVSNVGTGSMSRFIWLPTDGPRACNPGETPAPGGPYCVDPATHPNLQRDLQFMQRVMDLWKTPELEGKTPNDPAACADLIKSGRPDRCVKVTGLAFSYPISDYTGRLDWNTSDSTNMTVRYQYSRQLSLSPRIILGDNYGTNNNRQYNAGYTLTHVFSARQTGEFRYGFGNRNTNQEVTDSDKLAIPIIRFGTTLVSPGNSTDTLPFGGTVIGTSTNVPIDRFQRDHQFVYNHNLMIGRHTLRAGVDQRFQALDDIASGTQRGYWTFGTPYDSTLVAAGTGFTGWEMFLDGILTGYQMGYGQAFAENRFKETNLYFEDQFRFRPTLTLNLGARWEGVGAPHEVKDRFSYGYKGDYNNFEPRIGINWSPTFENSWLSKISGTNQGDFVVRAGYGLYHSRVFQSIFSQSGLNYRFQPPNGFLLGTYQNPCTGNLGANIAAPAGTKFINGGQFEISDPSCGFVFEPGMALRSTAGTYTNGVRYLGGQLQTSLLLPDPNFHLPYVSQWNLTVERRLPHKTAVQISYNGNRGIGLPFFSGINDAQFGIASPEVSVDVGGGNFQPVVFDRVCKNFSDPVCLNTGVSTNYDPTLSGALRSFAGFTAATVKDPITGLTRAATLQDKGIVIVDGVPHGYISPMTARTAERRPDPTNGRNVLLSNFAYTYYNALTTKVTKATSNGLTLSGWWTWSKTMDTGSEATYTGTDVNAPVGSRNPQHSLRGLSSFDQTHRLSVSASYELPWMKNQPGVLGRLAGGWTISGVSTFASGLPFTVLAGYDVNIDGNGGDRPVMLATNAQGISVDAGRPVNPCPYPLQSGRCYHSGSQFQINPAAFFPMQTIIATGKQAGNVGPFSGDQFPVAPGVDFPVGVAGRNSFFAQGQKNVDFAAAKSVRVREGMKLEMRFELYNAFNRVTFSQPARTVYSSTPLGRISGTANLQNYVNSARTSGARMGQLALRFVF